MKEAAFSRILERLIDVFSGNENDDARTIKATFDVIIDQYRKALGGGANHELFDSFLVYLNKRQELEGKSRQDVKRGIEKILQSIKADIGEEGIYVNGTRLTSSSPYETVNVTMRQPTDLNASKERKSADFHTYYEPTDEPSNEGTNRDTIYDNAPEPQNPVHNSGFLAQCNVDFTPARRQNAIIKPNNITLDDLFDKSKLEEIKSLVEQDKFNGVYIALKPFIGERSIQGNRKQQTLEVLNLIKEKKVTLEDLQDASKGKEENHHINQ